MPPYVTRRAGVFLCLRLPSTMDILVYISAYPQWPIGPSVHTLTYPVRHSPIAKASRPASDNCAPWFGPSGGSKDLAKTSCTQKKVRVYP